MIELQTMLSVSVHPDTEARLRQLAQQAGKDVTTYVAEFVERAAAAEAAGQASNGKDPAIDFDRALDELFAADTRKLPRVPLSYSREDIYFDHD